MISVTDHFLGSGLSLSASSETPASNPAIMRGASESTASASLPCAYAPKVVLYKATVDSFPPYVSEVGGNSHPALPSCAVRLLQVKKRAVTISKIAGVQHLNAG